MFHPSRGGVRGGKDQFKWDDVKQDKFRENYLGHSVMAPVGRWQKGKDLTWYAKGAPGSASAQSAEEQRRQEVQRVKEEEEAAMCQMLGLAEPKRRRTGTASGTGVPREALGQREAEALLQPGQGSARGEGERITGLGFGARRSKAKVELVPSPSLDGQEKGVGPAPAASRTVRGAQGGVADEDKAGGEEKPSKVDREGGKAEHDRTGQVSTAPGGDQSKGSSEDSESDSESDGPGSGEGAGDGGPVGESKSERKARKRREQRRERRRVKREEELRGDKGVSEKRLRRRRRELRVERKKQRREERKRRAAAEEEQAAKPKGSSAERKDQGGPSSFQDMFRAGHLMVDREGFVKKHKSELQKQRMLSGKDADREGRQT